MDQTNLFSSGPSHGAIISACGRYRYMLSRTWSAQPWATFIMLNPSTADACDDDPTIRKCMGFAKRWGMGGIRVVNLFAARATDPKKLLSFEDPVGPLNDSEIREALMGSIHVAAWGAHHPKLCAQRLEDLGTLFSRASPPLQCLGRCSSGAPRHPLRVSYKTRLEPWS